MAMPVVVPMPSEPVLGSAPDDATTIVVVVVLAVTGGVGPPTSPSGSVVAVVGPVVVVPGSWWWWWWSSLWARGRRRGTVLGRGNGADAEHGCNRDHRRECEGFQKIGHEPPLRSATWRCPMIPARTTIRLYPRIAYQGEFSQSATGRELSWTVGKPTSGPMETSQEIPKICSRFVRTGR